MISDGELVAQIRGTWRPGDVRAGRLIHKCHIYWHYAVALSDEMAISWGPKEVGLVGEGLLRVHLLDQDYFGARDVAHLSPPHVYSNLIASVFAFHRKWSYGVQGWNCEHWARLVASGDPVSYQVGQTGFGIFDIANTLRRHSSAKEHLAHYIIEA